MPTAINTRTLPIRQKHSWNPVECSRYGTWIQTRVGARNSSILQNVRPFSGAQPASYSMSTGSSSSKSKSAGTRS
jgi:hypothetical protein